MEDAPQTQSSKIEGQLHRIEDDLNVQAEETEAWVKHSLEDIEIYLGRHAAFQAFLEGEDEALS